MIVNPIKQIVHTCRPWTPNQSARKRSNGASFDAAGAPQPILIGAEEAVLFKANHSSMDMATLTARNNRTAASSLTQGGSPSTCASPTITAWWMARSPTSSWLASSRTSRTGTSRRSASFSTHRSEGEGTRRGSHRRSWSMQFSTWTIVLKTSRAP